MKKRIGKATIHMAVILCQSLPAAIYYQLRWEEYVESICYYLKQSIEEGIEENEDEDIR